MEGRDRGLEAVGVEVGLGAAQHRGELVEAEAAGLRDDDRLGLIADRPSDAQREAIERRGDRGGRGDAERALRDGGSDVGVCRRCGLARQRTSADGWLRRP